MKCFQALQRKSNLPFALWKSSPKRLKSQARMTSPSFLYISIFDVCAVTEVVEICSRWRYRTNYGHSQTRPVANLTRPEQWDQFGLFISISEEGSGEFTTQSQTRQFNEDSDPTEAEMQPTVSLSKASISRIQRPPWYLPAKIKRHHVTAVKPNVGRHPLLIRK